jgi:hypothetical protein
MITLECKNVRDFIYIETYIKVIFRITRIKIVYIIIFSSLFDCRLKLNYLK